MGLEPKEGNALVNGSPCAAALLADGALAAAGRVALAYEAFALSVEAFAAPLEAYDPELAGLWGDEGETTALQRLGALLARRPRASAPVTRLRSATASSRACSARPSARSRMPSAARPRRSRR